MQVKDHYSTLLLSVRIYIDPRSYSASIPPPQSSTRFRLHFGQDYVVAWQSTATYIVVQQRLETLSVL
jgi:hypothetical protein